MSRIMIADLNNLLVALNSKLESNNRLERFEHTEFSNNHHQWKGLKLRHLMDYEKAIDLYENENHGEYILYFLDTHQHVPQNLTENIAETIYKEIVNILDNSLLIVNEKTKNGEPLMSAFVYLLPDITCYKYSKKEYKIIKNNKIFFETWSENITDEMKLFAAGYVYTNHSQIVKDVNMFFINKYETYQEEKLIL